MPLVLVARAVALLPWSSLRRAGALIGALAGSVLRIRRAHVEAAVRRAGFGDVTTVARGMYVSLGTALLEFLWMVGKRNIPSSVVGLTARAQDVLARLDVADGSGKGIVVATAHTGNWDLVACVAAARHMPLSVVTKHLRVKWLDRFWQRERASRGLELLEGEGAFGGAARALSRGRSVALLIDQAPERSTAVGCASFMGQRAYCDLMPAMLAARARVPLVLALGSRNRDGTHTVDIPLVLEPPSRASRGWVEATTTSLNDALEVFVRAHPSQWLWLHRRWKGPPPRRAARQLAASFVVC